MPVDRYPETELYPPVKAFIEELGFEAKGEVAGCDLVAMRAGADEFVVVIEMKRTFNLELVLQGVARSSVCDEVWLAVGHSKTGTGRLADARVGRLCRRMGFGLLAVSRSGAVNLLVEPAPYAPRRNVAGRSKLMEEHRRRQGDPMRGGSPGRPIMTAYRQQALRVAAALADGPGRPRDLKALVPNAQSILSNNYHCYFVRLKHGLYGLTEAGRAAIGLPAKPFDSHTEAAPHPEANEIPG